jgi:hypothetical protein
MTTRNITKKFESLRAQFKSIAVTSSRSEWEIHDGKSALLSSDSHSDSVGHCLVIFMFATGIPFNDAYSPYSCM